MEESFLNNVSGLIIRTFDLIGNCLADQGEIGYYYLLTPSHLESYDDLSPEELVNTVKNLYNNREANGEENNTYFGYGVIDGTEDYNIEQTVDIQIDGSDFEEGYYVLRIVVAGTPSDDFGDVFNYSKMAVSPVFNTPLTPTVAIYTNVNVDEDTIQISGNIVDIVDDSVLTGTLKFEYSIDGTNWVSIPESIGLGAENAYTWDIPDAVKSKLFSIKATYSGDNTYNSAESEIYTVDLEAPAVTDLDVIKNDGKYEFSLMISNTEISVLNCYALLTAYSESGYDATTIDDIVDDNNLIEVSFIGNDDNVYTATIDESVFAPGVYVYQVVVADINGNMGEKLVTAPFVTTLSLTKDDLTASAAELTYSGTEQTPVVTLSVNNESETVKALIEDKVSAAVKAGDISYSFVRVKDAAGNEIEPEEAVTAVKEAGVYDIYAISDDADIQIDNVKIGKVTVNGGEKSAEPTLTEECSFSTDTMLVEISGIVNSTIYYNVDGTEYSKTCTGSAITFNISKTTTVTAYAVENGKLKSEEVERTYTKVDAQQGSGNTGNTGTPSGNTETPSGNTETPSGNTETPSGNTETPSGNTETPSGNTETPSGNTETPSGNTETPSGNTETPSDNTETPSGNNGTPAGDTGSSGDKDESGDNKIEVKELVITVPATIKYDPTITQPSGYFTGENPIANLVVTADGTELTSDKYFVLYTKNGSIIIKELNAGDKIDVKVSLLADDKVSSTASFMLENNGSIDPLCPVVEIDESTKEIVLVVGQTFTLPASKWKTSSKADNKIISVSKKGLLKAKKEGNATLIIPETERKINVCVVKPSLTKKITLDAGASEKLTLNTRGKTFNVKWYSSNDDVATVSDDGKVCAVAKGKAIISAYVNGKEYKCTVTVKEKTPQISRTIHLNVGKKQSVSIKGVKYKTFTGYDEKIVEVNKKKVKGLKAGETDLHIENKEYVVHVIVEDISITGFESKGKNKYKLGMSVGESKAIEFNSVNRDVAFKSSKPEIAYVSDGIIHALKAGRCSIQTKINGKTVTIDVVVNNVEQ